MPSIFQPAISSNIFQSSANTHCPDVISKLDLLYISLRAPSGMSHLALSSCADNFWTFVFVDKRGTESLKQAQSFLLDFSCKTRWFASEGDCKHAHNSCTSQTLETGHEWSSGMRNFWTKQSGMTIQASELSFLCPVRVEQATFVSIQTESSRENDCFRAGWLQGPTRKYPIAF